MNTGETSRLKLWNQNEKLCSIIEFSCPADINISRNIGEKMNTYGPLLRNLQIFYQEYKFEVIPIVIGAPGHVPKCLTQYLSQLGFNNIEIRKIKKCKILVFLVHLKICKTVSSLMIVKEM